MRFIVITLSVLLAAPGFAASSPDEQSAAKAVLVTGASSGIGRKITERLAADGYFVYATARKDADLKALGAIKNVQPLRLDVTQAADIAAAVESVNKGGRGLYGLVNNAGIATWGTIADMTLEEFDLTMKVNAYGPVMMTKAFEPLIIGQKGRIVIIGSVSGIVAGPDLAAYDMSKHAVEGLADSLALQLAPLGVHASVVEPGAYKSNIDKNMLSRSTLSEAAKADMIKLEGPALDPTQYPEADDVAEAVEHALFDPSPKHRYLVVPRHFHDRLNSHVVEDTIRWQIRQLVQLNEGQPYTYDRATLIRMLDEALVNSRPRTN
jgi:NAD(P)-dependent dehydrogenase (short-subunit alcohol dehydrogenase family)